MTIRELINFGIKKLSKSSTSAALDSEVLLSHVLDRPKEYLLTNPDHKLTATQEKQFKIILTRRLAGEPVAYIKKQKEFFGHKFYVDKNVLVPRPETEGLVDLVLQHLKMENRKLKILDLGTGSGNIIISLARASSSSLPPVPSPLFFASDISPKALVVAKKNAKQHQAKITFKQGSLLEPWAKRHFDIIVANLPYGWKQWKNESSTDTLGLKFEPQIALFTEENGLLLINKLLRQISQQKTLPTFIFLEIDPRQTPELKKQAAKLLPAYRTRVVKDLFGRMRYAVLVRK